GGPAVGGERGAHVGRGRVAVVGQALHQHRDAAGGVTLVGDRLVGRVAAFRAGAAADGPVDVLVRHRALLGLLHRVIKGGIARRVAAAGPRRHLDVLDQLGEQLAAARIHGRLLVLGRRPLGVATHVRSLTMSTKYRWMPRPPVNSGWKEVASSGPCRTATILPVTRSVPRTVTCSLTASTQGALINTARNGGSGGLAIPSRRMSLSNESTWRPNALRRTVIAIPPRVSWPSTPSSSRSASMIIPAQEPNAGIPPDSRLRSGSATSNAVLSFHMVVDSPPGITRPSTAASSSGRRTRSGAAPVSASARRCSTTSPCSARTPMTGADPPKTSATILPGIEGSRERQRGRNAAHRRRIPLGLRGGRLRLPSGRLRLRGRLRLPGGCLRRGAGRRVAHLGQHVL